MTEVRTAGPHDADDLLVLTGIDVGSTAVRITGSVDLAALEVSVARAAM